MEPKSGANYRRFTRVTTYQRRKFYPHAIPYGSYTEPTAVRGLIIAWLAVLCGLLLLVACANF
jgi:hypothetical protein